MVKNYFKIAWRYLGKNKVTAMLNIGGMAIAISAAILILLWVQNETRYDNYHSDVDRIYLLTEYHAERTQYGSEFSPYPATATIYESVPGIEMSTVAQPSLYSNSVFVVNGKKFTERNALYVDSNWVKMFHYEAVEGRIENFLYADNRILISQSKAKKYFGNLPPLEQTVLIDSVPYTVAAVIRDIPANSSFQQDILISNKVITNSKAYESHWGRYSQWLFVKLSPEVSVERTAEKITRIFADNQPWRSNDGMENRLISLKELHYAKELSSQSIPHGNPQNIRIFSLLAALILIAACINFVNISVARLGVRIKEVGIRKIMGAAKKQLFVQVMVETTLSILMAIGFAVLLSALALPFFNTFTERQFTLGIGDGIVSLVIIGIFIFVLLLTGIYPAFLVATLKPIGLLRKRSLLGTSQLGLRKVLVVVQFTLAVFMIIGIVVIQRQFGFMQQQVAGYQKEQVFRIITPPPKDNSLYNGEAIAHALQSLKNDLLASSNITHVSRVNGVSMIDDGDAAPVPISWRGYPSKEENPDLVNIWVDEDYMGLANLKLKAGRWFDRHHISDKNNIVLNESAVKEFGLKEPVIGTVYSGGIPTDGGIIIGVVEDFHHKSLREKIDPVVISMDPFMGGMYLVKARAGNIGQALADTEAIWTKRFPEQPFEYVFLDEEFNRLYKEDRKALTFALIFGSLSILIACLGLLGIVICSVQQRIKEIGIRKVLGASVSGIVVMLSKDFVKLVLIAIVISSPIAWWAMNTWLEDFAYRIHIAWWMFALAGLLTVFLALFTVGGQAIRSALANPVDSLRDE